MGQVALGIRSLLVKAAVFFVMCALLVWALGGQLFPAPEIVDGAAVQFDGRRWFWRLSAGGDEPQTMHWKLMVEGEARPEPYRGRRWREQAGLERHDDGLYYAGLPADALDDRYPWLIARIDADGEMETWSFPDRLAVEQQMERLRHGLSLQDVETVVDQRPAVLDPQPGSADEQGTVGADAKSSPGPTDEADA